MRKAGFGDAEPAGGTGFNSSPVTRGALFKGTRKGGDIGLSIDDGLKQYREFFETAYAAGAIDRKIKHLIALGASLAAGCEP